MLQTPPVQPPTCDQLAGRVDALLRKEHHPLFFTEQLACALKGLQPFRKWNADVWEGVDTGSFKLFLDKLEKLLQKVEMSDSNEIQHGTSRIPLSSGQLLPLPAQLLRMNIDQVMNMNILQEMQGDPRNAQQLQQPSPPIRPREGSLAEELLRADCFHGSLVQRSLCLAASAYNKHHGHAWSCGSEWRTLVKNKTSDLVVFGLDELDGGDVRVEIGFRGTIVDYFDQWLYISGNTNCDLCSMEGVTGKVHTGFRNTYQDTLREKIHESLKKCMQAKQVREILVSGHSRGGALATLCAVDLAVEFPSVPLNLVTYASPRVGNEAFVQFCKDLPNLRSARFVNGFDVVPLLPLAKDTPWLAHLQSMCAGMKVVEAYADFGDVITLDSWVQHFTNILSKKAGLIAAHSIERYGENLRNYFRDFRCVCLESLAPLAKDFVGTWLKSCMLGPAATISMRIGDLEKKLSDEMAGVKAAVEMKCNEVIQQTTECVLQIERTIEQQEVKKVFTQLRSKLNAVKQDPRGSDLQPLREATNEAVEVALRDVTDDVVKEKCCVEVLHAFEAMLISSVQQDKDYRQILDIAKKIAGTQAFLSLVAAVLRRKAKEQGLQRHEVRALLHDFSWPPDKTGGSLIESLQKLHRILSCMSLMTGDREVSSQWMQLSKEFKADEFHCEDDKNWSGWRLMMRTDKNKLLVKDVDGFEFEGDWDERCECPHGFGVASRMGPFGRLCEYEGEWSKGKMHGLGKYTLPDGAVLHNGYWIHGEPVVQVDVENLLQELMSFHKDCLQWE